MRGPEVRGSLGWVASDFRSLLPGASAGLLQLMYPALGHAVMEHSEFMHDPFGRVWRSIPQIWATLLAPDGAERALHVRDLHREIRGVDAEGARYHALDPDTFWWAHATFTWEMFRSVQMFHRRQLNDRERDLLYAETVEWYASYGVSMRPVPSDYENFVLRFVEVCKDELELTPAAEYAIEIANRGRLGLPLVPDMAMAVIRPLIKSPGRALAFGCMPTYLRQRMDIPWTTTDRRALVMLMTAMQRGAALVPASANRKALNVGLRQVGARTRDERYQPAR